MEELNQLLFRFYVDMRGGMEEFLRAYGMSTTDADSQEMTLGRMTQRLFSPAEGAAAMRDLEQGIQEIKVHHAALLEGYHQATHEGARRILETVDPEQLRKEYEDAKIRVGPLKLNCSWRPILVQAVWEEMLLRFRKYRALESADFERFFRDGFRGGYRRFREARLPQSADRTRENG